MSIENEEQLKCSIASQCNIIKDALSDWCINNSGIVVVAETINEKVMLGWNNCVGPRCLVVFTGEEEVGDPSVSELLGRVRRYYDISISRGKIQSDPRNSALVNTSGAAKPFYNLIEEARDIVRAIFWGSPFAQNPTEYHGIRPGNSNGEWLMDEYIINISVVVEIPRIQNYPGALGGGSDWIQLGDLLVNQNNPPSI